MFLVSHCSLIHIYEVINDICLYFMNCEIKKLCCFTCIFHTCVYAFVECFRIYRLVLSTLATNK